jgi:hypothetical protein
MTSREPIPLKGRQVTLAVAQLMIPYTSAEALRKWLCRRPERFPGRYRMLNRHLVRVLWESEIEVIQRMLVKELPPSHWKSDRSAGHWKPDTRSR